MLRTWEVKKFLFIYNVWDYIKLAGLLRYAQHILINLLIKEHAWPVDRLDSIAVKW